MFSGRRMEESAPTLNLADVRRTIEPLYEGQKLFTGESVMAHAVGVVDILRGIRDDDDLLEGPLARGRGTHQSAA